MDRTGSELPQKASQLSSLYGVVMLSPTFCDFDGFGHDFIQKQPRHVRQN
jgi:hypothetical protein